MLKIYLSGAITGREAEAKKEFAEAEKKLKDFFIKDGYEEHEFEIKNPFKILKINKKHKYEDYLKADIKVLVDCVALINIKNKDWQKSKGAKLERQIARALKIDIYNSVDALIKDFYDAMPFWEGEDK